MWYGELENAIDNLDNLPQWYIILLMRAAFESLGPGADVFTSMAWGYQAINLPEQGLTL